MASTYTPLGVELMATGENAGTWGTKTNTNLQIIEQIAGKSGVLNFIEKKELDTSYELDNNERYRVNCYMDSAGYSIALRHIPSNIPTLESL